MSENNSKITIEHIVDIIVRRWWIIIISFCIAIITGTVISVQLPKIYEAKTLILVQPQSVPSNYVQSLVTVDISSRITTISQQIKSVSNIEKLIKNFNLFPESENKKLAWEHKINNIREKITVNVTRTRRSTDSFSISFQGKNPEKITKVVNALASYFINENLKYRETQVQGTSNFLEDELEIMRVKLEAVEQDMNNYKRKYMGELPEQLDSNLRILDRLQEQLTSRQRDLQESQGSLLSLQNAYRGFNNTNGDVLNSNISEIDQLRNQLSVFSAKYTKQHPDIIKIKKRIAILEQELSDGAKTFRNNNQNTANSYNRRLQIKRAKKEIYLIKKEIKNLTNQIGAYKIRIENTPERELQLLSLQRDYQNMMDSYNSLLNRKLEAAIAVNMERKQKGEQFRVVDSARIPQTPIKPDLKKIFFIFIAVGLGICGGIVFLLEFVEKAFIRPEDIESQLNIPVFATIPKIDFLGKNIFKKINLILTVLSILLALLITTVFAIVSFMGKEKIVLLFNKLLHF